MKNRSTPEPRRFWGWIPDLPDQRDFLYADLGRVSAARLPTSVDLRSCMSKVEDQGALGSCTANALVGVLECLEMKAGQAFIDLSRLFIYYGERLIEHSVATDSGAMLRDGIKTLANQGVCSEKKWPYIISRFAKKPSAACYTEAKKRTIQSYHRITSLKDMRTCLAEGFPFVFGFSVYESFESAAVAKTGVLGMPKASERQLGGHAVCAVGYDDKAKRLLVRNSWGTSWGMKGYFTMPYDYASDRDLSDDFWTIRA